MSSLDKNIVEKSNELNTIRNYNPIQEMTLIEYRFFCLYLSKLNARNPNLRTMVISIKEFEELFGVSLHTTHFNDTIEKIMNRKLRIRNKSGKISIINLYSKFEWLDNNNCKNIEVTCNYDIVPYLFELKDSYTSYKIINIVHLNSVSKIRLYEVCKQYQKIGNAKFEIKELQEMLCCRMTQFRDFNSKILKPAIKDIDEYTDIMVSYEKILSCRKVVALKFTITKKNVLKDIIGVPNKSQNTDTLLNDAQSQNSVGNDRVMVLYYELDKAYSTDELEQLLDVCKGISSKPDVYLKNIYYQIKARKKKINNLFSYTLTVINADLRNSSTEEPKKKKSSNYDDTPSYDLDTYIEGLHHKYREEPFPNTQKYYFHNNEVTTFDIHTILKKNFDIYDDNLYDIRSLQGIIDYVYKKYNVLLIDVNPTGEYDKLAFGER